MHPLCNTSICETSQRCIAVNTSCPIMVSSPSTDDSSLLPQTTLSFNMNVNITTTESNAKLDTLDTSNFITSTSLTEHPTNPTNIITNGTIRQYTQNTIQSTSSRAIDIIQTTSDMSQDNIYISQITVSENTVNTTQNIVEFGGTNTLKIITISVTVAVLTIILLMIATFVILSLVIIVKRHNLFKPSKCTFFKCAILYSAL